MIALVVPTNRPASLRDFLRAWEPYRFWDDGLLVVVQGERTVSRSDLPADAIHVAADDIDHDLGRDAWIISQRDSAVRSYGFLVAWQEGADYICTLDDDTRPHPDHESLASLHAAPVPRFIESVPGTRTRGLPYGDRGTIHPAVSMGLWSGVPDLDAACSLAHGCPTDWVPPPGRRLIPRETLVPLCGMNVGFRAEAAPLMYFGLMGPPWPYARFDDIFCGLWAKRCLDHLGWHLAVGEPFVRHERASDPFVNLVKEGPGVAFHEHFWRLLADLPVSGDTPVEAMDSIGAGLEKEANAYVKQLGTAIRVWAAQFD